MDSATTRWERVSMYVSQIQKLAWPATSQQLLLTRSWQLRFRRLDQKEAPAPYLTSDVGCELVWKKTPAPGRAAFVGRVSVSPKVLCLKHLEPGPVRVSGDAGPTPGLGRCPEVKMATCSGIVYKSPWTEESVGSQRVGHNWATSWPVTVSPALPWMQNQRVQRASDTTPQCEELGFSDLGALGNIRPQIPRDQCVKYSVRMLRLSLAEWAPIWPRRWELSNPTDPCSPKRVMLDWIPPALRGSLHFAFRVKRLLYQMAFRSRWYQTSQSCPFAFPWEFNSQISVFLRRT